MLNRTDLGPVTFSGVMLSLHFVTFIFAVKVTTVANATFPVSSSPVILAVLSPVLLILSAVIVVVTTGNQGAVTDVDNALKYQITATERDGF